MTAIPSDVKPDIEGIMKKEIDKLSFEELKLRLAETEKRSQIVEMLSTDPGADVGPDDPVVITVPLAPDGNTLRINFVDYYGTIKVRRRTAEQIAYHISALYSVERERLISRSRDNGLFQMDPMMNTQIQRYHEIMGNEGGE